MNEYGRQTEQNFRTRRIIARLLSLAAMVERSACQFSVFRFFLLWLLRPMEVVVCNWAFDLAEDAGMPDLPEAFGLFDAMEPGEQPEDSVSAALNMALRLRQLASLLAFLYALRQAQGGAAIDTPHSSLCKYLRWLRTVAICSARLRTGLRAAQRIQRPEVRFATRPVVRAVGGPAFATRLDARRQ